MAISKAEKKRPLDVENEEKIWRSHVRKEDDSHKIWHDDWGWIVDEYRRLEHELKQKSGESQFLEGIREQRPEDARKLADFPQTTNHEYGWIAKRPEFRLDRFGSDRFRPLPLPPIYHIPK